MGWFNWLSPRKSHQRGIIPVQQLPASVRANLDTDSAAKLEYLDQLEAYLRQLEAHDGRREPLWLKHYHEAAIEGHRRQLDALEEDFHRYPALRQALSGRRAERDARLALRTPLTVDIRKLAYGKAKIAEDVSKIDAISLEVLDPLHTVYLTTNLKPDGRVAQMYDLDSISGLVRRQVRPVSPLTRKPFTFQD
ncbi:MAG: hypothetical protein EOO77_44160, partial [Oxalobacteraceae bacterium]